MDWSHHLQADRRQRIVADISRNRVAPCSGRRIDRSDSGAMTLFDIPVLSQIPFIGSGCFSRGIAFSSTSAICWLRQQHTTLSRPDPACICVVGENRQRPIRLVSMSSRTTVLLRLSAVVWQVWLVRRSAFPSRRVGTACKRHRARAGLRLTCVILPSGILFVPQLARICSVLRRLILIYKGRR